MAAKPRNLKAMSQETYELMVDLQLSTDEIELIYRMIFNDLCAAYDVCVKRENGAPKRRTRKKKTAKKASTITTTLSRQELDDSWQKEYDRDWMKRYERRDDGSLYILKDEDKKKDQLPTSSLIVGETKRIKREGTSEANEDRRKRILKERDEKPKPKEEPPRKGKKRRGEW